MSEMRETGERTSTMALNQIVLALCDDCLDGKGGECHVPGCALWMNRAPDVPIREIVAGLEEGVSGESEERAIRDAFDVERKTWLDRISAADATVMRLRFALARIEERLNPGKTGNPAHKVSECLHIASEGLDE